MNTIYTMGYTGWSYMAMQDFFHEISLESGKSVKLMDIRMSAGSRAPMWRKHSLQAAFQSEYLHVPQLGNIHYHGGGLIEIADFPAGMQIVRDLVRQHTIVLMCGCEIPIGCHRHAVAKSIVKELQMRGDSWTYVHKTCPAKAASIANLKEKAMAMMRSPLVLEPSSPQDPH